MEKLLEAVRDVAAGKMIMPAKVALRLAQGLSKLQPRQREEPPLPQESQQEPQPMPQQKSLQKQQKQQLQGVLRDLTQREYEIAVLMAQGFTNVQIAAALYISKGTVRNYISDIYSKIGIGDRIQAVLFLKEQGI